MALLLIKTPDEQTHAALLAVLDELKVHLVREIDELDMPPKVVVKRKWAGSISKETGRLLQEEVTRLREQEWERNF